MNKKLIKAFLVSFLFLAAVIGVVIAPGVKAGGPLIVQDGVPTKWPRALTQGGPLSSQTVDAQGNILYRVDSGTLGTLSNEEATGIVDRIFSLYSSIPTSSIKFVNAGRILDPSNRQPIDVTGSNVNRFLSSSNPTFQNPIIFDSDGSILGTGGVLGRFGALQLDENNNLQIEGAVVLNGLFVSRIGKVPFIGVFTHEFGHFAGPLDHSQINGNIAERGTSATLPVGFNAEEIYDLYAPFTETLFPFLFNAPVGAGLNPPFYDSGFFVASLDMDTRNALSNLYPAPGFRATDPGSPNGAIQGNVVIRTATGDIPISGINVVARRISRGVYPPPFGTTAYPNNQVTLDSDGVPLPPPDRDVTDSLATASSAVTGLEFGTGGYRIEGLPPGDYLVEVQQINPNAVGGSGIGPNRDGQFPLLVLEQVSDHTPVSVAAGVVTSGIDIALDGFNVAALPVVNEVEGNDKKKKAQRLSFPVEVHGSASDQDGGKVRIDFGEFGTARLHDLYRFTVTTQGVFVVALEPITGSGDLDLYVLDEFFEGKKIPFDDFSIVGSSTSPQASELVAVRLIPGTYYIGVSAFEGNFNYRLRIISSQ